MNTLIQKQLELQTLNLRAAATEMAVRVRIGDMVRLVRHYGQARAALDEIEALLIAAHDADEADTMELPEVTGKGSNTDERHPDPA